MARPPRIEFQNAFYHVIVRGNRRQEIFSDDSDRMAYLDLLNRYKKRCGFILYAYVLMSNHVHLLIETPEAPISKIMQMLNFTYTQYFNRKYDKVGHLFQGRYKSYLCDRDEYLLGLVRYIHLNPVRASLAAGPDGYRWSGHVDYIGKGDGLADADRVLRLFSENKSQARRLYIRFVNEAIGTRKDESFYKAIEQQILGDEKFVEKVEKTTDRIGKPLRKPSTEAIFDAVERLTGVRRDKMISRGRMAEAVFARGLLAGMWREAGLKMKDLQPILKRDLSTLSKSARVAESKEGQRAMKELMKNLYS
ncbi:MAG: transposase [Nitrospirae bacterium]|nr:transposase [Nitrospirota bacterium]